MKNFPKKLYLRLRENKYESREEWAARVYDHQADQNPISFLNPEIFKQSKIALLNIEICQIHINLMDLEEVTKFMSLIEEENKKFSLIGVTNLHMYVKSNLLNFKIWDRLLALRWLFCLQTLVSNNPTCVILYSHSNDTELLASKDFSRAELYARPATLIEYFKEITKINDFENQSVALDYIDSKIEELKIKRLNIAFFNSIDEIAKEIKELNIMKIFFEANWLLTAQKLYSPRLSSRF